MRVLALVLALGGCSSMCTSDIKTNPCVGLGSETRVTIETKEIFVVPAVTYRF